MSSISYINKKIVSQNKNLQLNKQSIQKHLFDLNQKSKIEEAIILSPKEQTLTYSKTFIEPNNSNLVQFSSSASNASTTNTTNAVSHLYDEPEHPEGPCYAELLGFGHSLRSLTPVFHAIKSIVTNTKKTISGISLPEGISSITHPLNTFMNSLSDKFTSALNSMNPFLKKSSIDSKLSNLRSDIENIRKVQTEVNAELSKIYPLKPSVTNNQISETKFPWKILKNDNKSSHFVSTMQNAFKILKNKPKLNDMFLKKLNHSNYLINGTKVFTNSPRVALEKISRLIPDFESRQLISSYAHEGIFGQTYLNLIKQHPELKKSRFKHSNVLYKINQIDKDSFKLVATTVVQLKSINKSTKTTNPLYLLGMRSLVHFSKNSNPSMKSAFFIN